MTTLSESNDTAMTTHLPIPGPAPKPLIGNARDIDTSRTLESIMELARQGAAWALPNLLLGALVNVPVWFLIYLFRPPRSE